MLHDSLDAGYSTLPVASRYCPEMSGERGTGMVGPILRGGVSYNCLLSPLSSAYVAVYVLESPCCTGECEGTGVMD